MNKPIVSTKPDQCVGCFKCILHCPSEGANYTEEDAEGNSKVKVRSEKCIGCGYCISVCDHNARTFADDTERFFDDLKKGKKISVVAAPIVRYNFDNFKKIFSFLKKQGVNVIYDVSFGADITTWAYLKAIKEKGLKTLIAQPCPAIVNQIERYHTELIPYLAPIHSPALCTAVYLRRYKQNTDKIAFLSPCLSKRTNLPTQTTSV